jgi:hypothetical protein
MGNFFIKRPLARHHYKCSNLQNRGFYSKLTSRNSVLVNRSESMGSNISSSLRKIIATGPDYTYFNIVTNSTEIKIWSMKG